MVPITQTFDRDDHRSADDGASNPEVGPDDGSDPASLLCWICRQPLSETTCIRWRGEPVHPDCL